MQRKITKVDNIKEKYRLTVLLNRIFLIHLYKIQTENARQQKFYYNKGCRTFHTGDP